MHWIFVSPHLDDAALSCGGLIWEQARRGEGVSIWTICAGDPPGRILSDFAQALHARWGYGADAARRRRDEDRRAAKILGATPVHFSVPDCIYRRSEPDGKILYPGEDTLFGDLHPADSVLMADLILAFNAHFPETVELVSPLSLGGHVDHRLTRTVLERLGRPLWYYADFPYLQDAPEGKNDPETAYLLAGLEPEVFQVSRDGLNAWQDAVAAYTSQISTFWAGVAQMRDAIRDYWGRCGGVQLWRPIENLP